MQIMLFLLIFFLDLYFNISFLKRISWQQFLATSFHSSFSISVWLLIMRTNVTVAKLFDGSPLYYKHLLIYAQITAECIMVIFILRLVPANAKLSFYNSARFNNHYCPWHYCNSLCNANDQKLSCDIILSCFCKCLRQMYKAQISIWLVRIRTHISILV